MDSCLAEPRAVAERTKSYRATHSSLLLHGAAVASSKPRKPSASASRPSARLHPPTSRIPAPLLIEKKAGIEPALILQGLPFPKSGEKSAAGHEALRKEMAVVKDEASKHEKDLVADENSQGEKVGVEDEALKEIEAVAEDETVEIEKAVAKDGALGEEMTLFVDEALRTAGIQSDVSPLQDIAEEENSKGHDFTEYKDALAENEEKKGDSAETSVTDNSQKSLVATDTQDGGVPFDQVENKAVTLMLETEGIDTDNALTNFLKVPARQDPSSPVAETKTIVYSEQSPKSFWCTGQTVPGLGKKMEGELGMKQSGHRLIFTEHLNSEQEGFLFTKGEAIFKESTHSSEGLPAVECSTLKKFKEQDASSFSQSETAVISASDLKPTPPTVLDVACNGISSMPSSEDIGFIEAAMFALAKDVLAKCPALENVHCMSGWPTLSWPWKLPRRVFVIPFLVVPALLCLLYFTSAVTQGASSYLHPT